MFIECPKGESLNMTKLPSIHDGYLDDIDVPMIGIKLEHGEFYYNCNKKVKFDHFGEVL